MVPRRHLGRRCLALVLAAAALVVSSGDVAPGVEMIDPSPSDVLLVDWVLTRYAAAGLEIPPVEIAFHEDPAGCFDNSGYSRGGRVEMCVADATEPYRRRVLLHELAHAWSGANLDPEDRERFLEVRGLETWNSGDVAWGRRGFEQVAEVITWAVGDRTLPVFLEDRDDAPALATAYVLLTRSATVEPDMT